MAAVSTPRGLQKRSAEDSTALVSNKRQKLPYSIYRTQVLSEDDYTEALARIIRRDFFPDLHAKCLAEEAEARRQRRMSQSDALSSFASIDPTRMDWATARSRLKETPVHYSHTPVETPRYKARAALRDDVPENKPYDESLSLTAFLSKYTSEDNASFAEILQRQNQARREKFSWAYDTEAKANAIEDRNREARQKLIECIQRAVSQSENGEVMLIEGLEPGRPSERLVLENGQTSIIADKQTLANAKQRLITAATESIAQGSNLIEGGKQKLLIDDGKSASTSASTDRAAPDTVRENVENRLPGKDIGLVETWKYTARNPFMFPPDANQPLTAVAVKRSGEEEDRLGMTAPKAINHANTRILHAKDDNDAPPSPTRSNIAAAISGTPYPGRGEPATPKVNGFGFVDRMPEPEPERIGKAGLKQLMTFGTLSATPVALRRLDDGGESVEMSSSKVKEGPFKIPATPRREEIAHRLARSASKSLSSRHGVKLPTVEGALANHPLAKLATPRYDGESSASRQAQRKDGDLLSPAAKTLLKRTGIAPRASSLQSPSRSSLGGEESRRAKQRERLVQERLRKATWEPTPVSDRQQKQDFVK